MMKRVFKEAHKMTKEMVEKYKVNYQAQFSLCLSYLLNKEEKGMTMEKWYNELTGEEKTRLENALENRMLLKSRDEKQEIWNELLEEKYNAYLQQIEQDKQKEEIKQIKIAEEEKQHQENLERGIATIELYESNRFRCWLAEITGTDSKYGFTREFISPTRIEGNYKTYELKEGKLYNYLNDNKQHLVKVANSKLVEMTKSEIEEILG